MSAVLRLTAEQATALLVLVLAEREQLHEQLAEAHARQCNEHGTGLDDPDGLRTAVMLLRAAIARAKGGAA